MTLDLPLGYRFRPARPDDAAAVARVLAAAELADAGKAETTTEQVLSDWEDVDLADEAAVLVGPDGDIVASVDLVNRSYMSVSVYGYVHPDHRGKGIGRVLIDWGERWTEERMHRAPGDARIVVQHFQRSTNETFKGLLERSGYTPVRGYYTMETDLDAPPPAPDWPEGITVRTHQPGQDERTTYEAVEDSFRDLWGRPKNTFERFLRLAQGESFDPTLWFLALDGDQVAGICLCKFVGDQAIVETLGVLRPWRNRGLGLALLLHSFGVFWQRGKRNVWLSVDAESLTGAPRLYGRAGMHVTGHYIMHQKELRAGVDYSQHLVEA
ncbi:MAG TPA: GNAT family N-acetyltransferase [Thermomicrobiales bacterium]|nr:GNAT family N-acetyltransferase [Thermomicrobiales bacterium]